MQNKLLSFNCEMAGEEEKIKVQPLAPTLVVRPLKHIFLRKSSLIDGEH